jgi:hypothetical protein
MSIDDEGFLAETDIMVCRNQIRQHYAPYFDLIHRTNTLCQQAKFRLDGTSTTLQNRMAVHLMVKLLGDTQGAALLVERGLASQARALLRAACETCIVLAKVCQDANFPRLYLLCEDLAHVRWLKNFLSDKTGSLNSLREEFRSRYGVTFEKMKQREEKLKKRGAKKLDLSLMAQEARLSALYHSYYMLYCKDTHASPFILTSYSQPNQTGEFEEIVWGPVVDDLEAILLLIPRLMLLGLAALDMIISLSLGPEFTSLNADLRSLEHPQKT